MQTSVRSRSHAPDAEKTTSTPAERSARQTEVKPDRTPGRKPDTGSRSRPRRTPVPEHILVAWDQWAEEPSADILAVLVSYYMETHVRRIAERLSARLPEQVDIDDLMQEGYIGLVDCIHRFDPERNIKFETFSSARVNGAMRDYLRRLDNVPRLVRARERRFQRVIETFRKDNGRAPSDAEIRDGMELDQPRFWKFMTAGRAPSMVQFSHTARGDDGESGDELDGMPGISDTRAAHCGSPRAIAEHEDLRRWISSGFARRDQLIITLYYYERMTMKEVGEVLGICESRVSQRLEVILQALRARLQDTGAEVEFEFRD